MPKEARRKSENASIVQATSLMAGNGVVLLNVYDVVNYQAAPLQNPLFFFVGLILPPMLGLVCGVLMLGRLEIHTYNAGSRMDQWLFGLSMGGIGVPLGLWIWQVMGLSKMISPLI